MYRVVQLWLGFQKRLEPRGTAAMARRFMTAAAAAGCRCVPLPRAMLAVPECVDLPPHPTPNPCRVAAAPLRRTPRWLRFIQLMITAPKPAVS